MQKFKIVVHHAGYKCEYVVRANSYGEAVKIASTFYEDNVPKPLANARLDYRMWIDGNRIASKTPENRPV